MTRNKIITLGQTALAAVIALALPSAAFAEKVMTVTATEPMTTDNPYGDSSAAIYSLWCHTYGCLGRYDYEHQKLVGVLTEKWEAIDPLTWRFTLRKGLKRQDGGPGPTSADVVASLHRIRTDPESAQTSFIAMVKEIVPVDDYTFDVKTKGPAVNLPMALFDRLAVTSKELYEKYGREADKKHAFGWGPYKLEEYQADRRVVIRKNPDWKELDGSDTKDFAGCRDLPADARARAAGDRTAQRRSAGGEAHPAATRSPARRQERREGPQDRRHRSDVHRLQQHDGAVDRRAAAPGCGLFHQPATDCRPPARRPARRCRTA